MVEVEKLCKKILFIINLGRIKQITRDECSSKWGGGGCNPHNPSPGSASASTKSGDVSKISVTPAGISAPSSLHLSLSSQKFPSCGD